MIPKLPLHSPRWRDLDGVTAEEVRALLAGMASGDATGSGDAWSRTWKDLAGGLVDDGTVLDGAYAALPHLVEAAAALPPDRTADLWVDLGIIVTAEDRPPVPDDLAAGFDAALPLAEQAAVRSLLAADAPAEDRTSLALSCLAFAGHHIATALWSLRPQDGYLSLCCPGCESDTEIPDFFTDPVRPPLDAPRLPEPARDRPGTHPWGAVATALREEDLGEGWEPFLRVARDTAAAGVHPATPGRAALCLVAAVVAAKGTPREAGRRRARELMLLTGYFSCWDCERTWTIADGLAEHPDGAHPRDHGTGQRTDADRPAPTATPAAAGPTGALPTRLRREGRALLTADGTAWAHLTVFSGPAPDPVPDPVPGPTAESISTDSFSAGSFSAGSFDAGSTSAGSFDAGSTSTGSFDADSISTGSIRGVDSLTVLARPGQPVLVAGAGAGAGGAVFLWDPADGGLVRDPLPGRPGCPDRVRSMTALPLPDGRVLLATGDETGTIVLWDPATGRPVREPAGNPPGEVVGMCAATVPDGRTLLVTATSRGAVRSWDPATGEAVGRLNPYGSPIRSITAVPVSAGHTLVVAADTGGGVHVWDPAVDDPWSRGVAVQLNGRALGGAVHRVAAVAAVPAPDRALLATGDDQGVVRLWDLATGDPAGDALPASTGTAGLQVMTATALPDGRRVLAVGSGLGRLRVWEPATGTVQHIALGLAPTCLAATGPDLIVGHDRGAFTLPLTGR
ncbi:WD40 repeat domain-containing protein [Streptomyces humi]|uniref:WD40 repeat domain-containing protein n=1 Tax=Streptomyces humi TaxID=1428620 RepID=UPI0007C78541|nr:WD40 repeat domain-containing protein [Streptomyces humi]